MSTEAVLDPNALITLERSWKPGWIVLSYILASVGSNATLHILAQSRRITGTVALFLVVGCAALSLSATGIFAMHFVGMSAIAYSTPGGVSHDIRYQYGLTVLSICLPFAFTWIGFALLVFKNPQHVEAAAEVEVPPIPVDGSPDDTKKELMRAAPSPYSPMHNLNEFKRAPHLRLLIASFLISGSVCVMHYVGMQAQVLDVRTEMSFNWTIIVISGVICETAAWLALNFGFVLPLTQHLKLLTAAVMGVAVCVMHYTGMYGIDFKIRARDRGVVYDGAPGFPGDGLRVVVSQFAVLWNLSVAVVSGVLLESREKELLTKALDISFQRAKFQWVLNIYRPYLPAHLVGGGEGGGSKDDLNEFEDEDDEDYFEPQSPGETRAEDYAMGARSEAQVLSGPPPEGDVAMVFTDIQSSTALWEACGEAMGEALDTHNKVLREHCAANSGYEVKTIGDALMAAFQGAPQAVRFALGAQQGLADSEWPDIVLKQPLCTPVRDDKGRFVWNGIRIRIGIHYGAAKMTINPITGRADYFGNVVNKAARCESNGVGGMVTVTPEVIQQCEGTGVLDGVIRIQMGGIVLKGIKGSTELVGLLPAQLEGRKELCDQVLQERRAEAEEAKAGAGVLAATRHHLTRRQAGILHLGVKHNVVIDPHKPGGAMTMNCINSTLAAVEATAANHGASILHVSNNVVEVGVNLAKPHRHFAASVVRCAVALRQVLIEECTVAGCCSIGVATGNVLFGNVGSATKSFSVPVGDTVERARLALGMSMTLNLDAVQCALGEDKVSTRAAFVRPVECWPAPDGGAAHRLVFYQLDSRQYPPPKPEAIWGSQYLQAFFAAWPDDRSEAACVKLSKLVSDNPVLSMVAQRVISGQRVEICTAWFLHSVTLHKQTARRGSAATACTAASSAGSHTVHGMPAEQPRDTTSNVNSGSAEGTGSRISWEGENLQRSVNAAPNVPDSEMHAPP